MAARAAGTGRAGEAGAACLRRPAGARARRESAAAAVAALRRRSAGAAPAGTAAAGAGLCPRRFAGGRRTDPAGVRRIARRSLAGRVAGGTRRTGPGRIGGAAGGSPGCAAGAPGVDLRTVRRQRGGGAGGGLFRLAGRPARRCRQPAGGAPAVAGGAHCTAGATTPARSWPASGDSPGLPGRAARRPLPAAAPGQRTRRCRSALVGGLPPECGAGCRSAAAGRAAACLALRTAVAAQCRRRGRAVPALALSRCARTITLPGAAPGVASAVRPGAPGGSGDGPGGARRRLVAEPARSARSPRGRRAPGPGPAPRGAARLARERRASVLRRAAPQRHWPADPAVAGRLARPTRRAAGGGRRLAADPLGRLGHAGRDARSPMDARPGCRRAPGASAAEARTASPRTGRGRRVGVAAVLSAAHAGGADGGGLALAGAPARTGLPAAPARRAATGLRVVLRLPRGRRPARPAVRRAISACLPGTPAGAYGDLPPALRRGARATAGATPGRPARSPRRRPAPSTG